ncbi:OMEGA-stichotoxin-Sgt1a-like [Acropora millepora]|uniref:OMEGA-stichotoxin-Sgt1a-like n=1 Tax=Acropora millepora TaxID=45264 RepID=UPI0010FCA5D4|nr:OMEGA-stichotoxin-Sgt1a-like [Acropora millepora]
MKTALVLFVLVGIVCAVKEKGKDESSKPKSGSVDTFFSHDIAECLTQSERDHYCFSGGTCFRIRNTTDHHCRCAPGFTGERCEMMLPHTNV